MNPTIRNMLLVSALNITLMSTSSAQHKNSLILKGHNFTADINPYTGNFSVINTAEPDPDLSTLLFTGPATSSHVGFWIDSRNYSLSELRALYPLGISVGSQVDGIFLGSLNRDLHIELAYFIMDINGSSMFKTLGIAISISNTSPNQTRKVGAKIMLDTDIGEHKNNPLFYLPDGTKVDTSYKMETPNIPSYIFSGETLKISSTPKGMYTYPYLSENLPNAVIIGNWKQLNDADWIPETLDSSFSANSDGINDAGIGLYFGEYTLSPGQSINFGSAISVQESPLNPLLDEKILKNGVFSEERFEINEMVSQTQGYNIFHSNRRMLINQDTKPLPVQRGPYQSPLMCIKSNTPTLPFETLYRDSVWGSLLKLNIDFNYQQKKYQESMNISIPQPYPDPPSKGIIGTNIFPIDP